MDNAIFPAVRRASLSLLDTDTGARARVLLTLADLIIQNTDTLLEANASDLARMEPSNPLYDRLMLTPERLNSIADDLRKVTTLPCPVGEIVEARTLPNGIRLRQVRVPYGVVGVIYEARPNVTFDVFGLCLYSANACILKGGRDAENSNRAAISLIHKALTDCGLPADLCVLLPSTHEATAALLSAVGYVNVCIPRGGRKLIDFVRDNARVPVIETGAGVVHTYLHADADPQMAARIVENGKTRRVSVCNALDTLLVHRELQPQLPAILAPLAAKGVELHADPEAINALSGSYPPAMLVAATDEDWDREWMDYKMGIKTVGDFGEAVAHIARHGSGHSESIVTSSPDIGADFQRIVDASSVYVNLPTAFTDGGQFGLGAEIGISTQKLGPRGPMGLRALTTTKYLLDGNGQTRP